MVNKAIQDKCKAIVIAPIDPEGLNECLKNASDAGITIITIDSDATINEVKSHIGANNENAGAIAARQAAEIIGGKGEIAIVGHVKESQTAIERVGSFRNGIKSLSADEKAMPIVAEEYCDSNAEKAKEVTATLLKKYPDLKLLYGTNEKSTIGICEAVEEAGLSGTVKVVGFDSSEEEIDFINRGTLTGTMLQNPYNMGYLGVRYSDKSANGNYITPSIDTGAIFVGKSNINSEEVQSILNS